MKGRFRSRSPHVGVHALGSVAYQVALAFNSLLATLDSVRVHLSSRSDALLLGLYVFRSLCKGLLALMNQMASISEVY